MITTGSMCWPTFVDRHGKPNYNLELVMAIPLNLAAVLGHSREHRNFDKQRCVLTDPSSPRLCDLFIGETSASEKDIELISFRDRCSSVVCPTLMTLYVHQELFCPWLDVFNDWIQYYVGRMRLWCLEALYGLVLFGSPESMLVL